MTVAIPLISVCGASVVPYLLRPWVLYATGILMVGAFIFSDVKIRINAITGIFAALIVYIAIGIGYSLDPGNTVSLLTVYLCTFPMLFLDLPEDTVTRILTVCRVITVVIALSILISVPIYNCMDRYFWFIVNPSHSPAVSRALARELAHGSYSGFAREMGEAAFIMNIGLAISASRLLSANRVAPKEIVVIAIQMLALLMTGKRTYFLAAVFCIALLFFFTKTTNKAFKGIVGFICIAIAAFIIIMFIPKTANIFNKFLDTDNVNMIGGRSNLWPYIFSMIDKYWLFGCGFGSYNLYSYRAGLRVYGETWNYNAHNSYLQFLGELGIFGFILLIAFIIAALVVTLRTIHLARKNNSTRIPHLFFSLYIQVMIIIYSSTGNPLYTKQFLFIWLFAIGLVLSIRRGLDNTPRSLRRNHYE